MKLKSSLFFEFKMNWFYHLKYYVETDIIKRLNVMKMISHTTWGGGHEPILLYIIITQ